jgi:ABC-type glycerol-3-phosphate transport system substrate-binding protein
MFKKTRMFILMGLLAWALAACGSGSGGAGDSKPDAAAARLEAAISQVSGVTAVNARYSVQAGMGSTVHIRITAAAGTESLETVMTESLKAFAGAADGIKTTAGVSFQVTESGQENTTNPTAVGLPQSPTVAQVIDFANGKG